MKFDGMAQENKNIISLKKFNWKAVFQPFFKNQRFGGSSFLQQGLK